jgi:ribosome biogenesis GTPase / thiamine phosphate phosphatase
MNGRTTRDPQRRDAQVLRVAGPSATVQTPNGIVELRVLPQIEERPVVGDYVRLRDPERPDATIVEVLPRETELLRGGGREGEVRTVVANSDLLIVVAAVVDPPLRPRLIDRYLVAGHYGGLRPSIVLTKVDLDHDRAAVAEFIRSYRAIGYPVLHGVGSDPELGREVTELVGDSLATLAGHSGVGKSTLTRVLTGVDRQVGAVSEKVGKGRHTTSDPRLIPLIGGRGAIVDTAGVRTFFLPPLDGRDLEAGFPEIARQSPNCRFRGCRHNGEAGCSVAGVVSEERLDSYRRLLATSTGSGAKP